MNWNSIILLTFKKISSLLYLFNIIVIIKIIELFISTILSFHLYIYKTII